VSKKTVRLESRVRNRKIPQTRRGNRKRVFEPPILSDTLMISSPNTDLLVDELESLCQEEGVDAPFEHALATAMQTLEVDTVTRLSSWGHCCLLAVPVLAADVSRLKQQLMIAAAPGTLPDNAALRTIVGGIARSVPKLVAAYDKSKEPAVATPPLSYCRQGPRRQRGQAGSRRVRHLLRRPSAPAEQDGGPARASYLRLGRSPLCGAVWLHC
jgi:hypothetical protein